MKPPPSDIDNEFRNITKGYSIVDRTAPLLIRVLCSSIGYEKIIGK